MSLALADGVRIEVVTLPVALLVACIWRGVPTPESPVRPLSNVVVCGGGTLSWGNADSDPYSSSAVCRHAVAAADYALSQCIPRGRGCETPEFAEGQPLADPASEYDLAFVVHVGPRDERVVRWRPQRRTGLRGVGEGPVVATSVLEAVPGLTGTVYLFAPRDGTIVEVRAVHGAALEEFRPALEEMVSNASRR